MDVKRPKSLVIYTLKEKSILGHRCELDDAIFASGTTWTFTYNK